MFLSEDFKSQKQKFVSQGYDEKIVDKYLDSFKQIKDKKDNDKLIDRLLQNNQFISNLEYDVIYDLLRDSNDPDKLIDRLGKKGEEFISNLNFNNIYYLFKLSYQPDKLIDILGEKGGGFYIKLGF